MLATFDKHVNRWASYLNLPKYYLHLKKLALEALERRKYVSTSGINYDSEFFKFKNCIVHVMPLYSSEQKW